jgi:hypothetical protein
MTGVLTVGSGRGSGPTTTTTGAGSNVALVTTPKAAVPPRPASRPSTGPAGAVRAVGALLALVLRARYVRFTPASTARRR